MTELENHVEVCMQFFKNVITITSNRLEALKDDERITQQALVKHVADHLGMTSDKVYHIVKVVLNNYPNKVIKSRGSEAGISNK